LVKRLNRCLRLVGKHPPISSLDGRNH
jgi:hypothetical protein